MTSGSAHVKMLGRQGIIPREEAEQIVTALGEIREEIDKGDFAFKEELEDIHLKHDLCLGIGIPISSLHSLAP